MTAPLTATTAADPRIIAGTPTDNDNPAIPHPAYYRMKPRWEKCRALMTGSEAVRAGEEDFLPRFEAEDDGSYDIRVQLAALYDGFARVVTASVGMLLQQEPQLGNDMPAQLKELWENVDGARTHGAVFSSELLQSGIVDGHNGILVDYANPDGDEIDRSRASAAAEPGKPLSADDEARLGLRPYWILFKADDVVKAVYATVSGVRTLVLLILREITDVRVGPFGVQSVIRYRVYTNDRGVVQYQLWEVPPAGDRPTKKVEPRAMRKITRIPWAPFRAGQILSEVETKPPLLALADLVIEHHQTKTNYLNLQTLACVPTQVRIGATPDSDGNYPEIVLGPRSTIEAPFVEGMAQHPIYWHSPDVSVLEPAQKTMEAQKADMGAAGMAFLAPQTRAAETAEAKRIDSTAQNATLSTVSRRFQDCLETAFGFTAEFLGLKGGSVTVNKDWEAQLMDANVMNAYATLVAAGFPKRAALEMLQAGGRIKPDADLEELEQEWEVGLLAAEDQKRIEADANQPPIPNRNSNGNGTGANPAESGTLEIVRDEAGRAKKLVRA